MANQNISKEFHELIKSIGETKSKQEEDEIVLNELNILKTRFQEPGNTKKKMKELVIRLMYVEMLGHEAEFGYIRAVELTASTNIGQKRAGYLSACLCLPPSHDFRFMLTSQLRKDLSSANILDVCAALATISKIVTLDMAPPLLADIIRLMTHESEMVRKKSVSAFHRMIQIDRSVIVDNAQLIRRVLCDRDPAVMGVCLQVLIDISKDDPNSQKDLIPSFVSILKQVTEHRLPRDFDYHRLPAPWIQLSLLRILAILGKGDRTASEGMYEVLIDVLRRADSGITIGFAVVYEAIRTITSIYPNTALLDAAAASISRFISSDNHNLKYMGIKALTTIVKDHPQYAAAHQLAVIDCLEDPDETLKRKTLDLLHRMTNPGNVEFIVQKLVSFLESATDEFFREDLVKRITQCSESFAPSNGWFIRTMTRVFELAGDKVPLHDAQTMMQLIAEGSGDDGSSESDDELRTESVETLVELLSKPKLPDILIQVMAWVLGEYGYLSTSMRKEDIADRLCDLYVRGSNSVECRCFLISAVQKLVSQSGSCSSKTLKAIEYGKSSVDIEIQQRCKEFSCFLSATSEMVEVLPVDASCEDIQVDRGLRFLDSFVASSRANGASNYCPPPSSALEDDDDEYEDNGEDGSDAGSSGGGRRKHKTDLKFTPYAKPEIRRAAPIAIATNNNTISSIGNNDNAQFKKLDGATAGNSPPPSLNPSSSLNLRGVNQVWGKAAAQPAVVHTPETIKSTISNTPPAASKITPVSAVASAPRTFALPVVEQSQTPHEPTERELMAQQLFGSGSSSSGGRVKKAETVKPKPEQAKQQQSPSSTPLAVTGSSPVFIASRTTPVASTSSSSANDLLDIFSSSSSSSSTTASSKPIQPMLTSMTQPVAMSKPVAVSSTRNPEPSSSSSSSDPFSAAGLLSMTPILPASMSSNAIIVSGQALQPYKMVLAEFGGSWSNPRSGVESKVSTSPTGIRTLAQVTQLAASIPAHYVEGIPQTMEAVLASQVLPSKQIVLIHIRLNPPRNQAEITVKAVDSGVSSGVAERVRSLFAN